MPDKVIEIPGVGNIAFPDSMSDTDIAAASAKLYKEKQGALGITAEAKDPNTVGTFFQHFKEQASPIGIGQMLPLPKEIIGYPTGGAGWDAPITAAKHILQAQTAVKEKGDEEWAKGNTGLAIAHYLHWLMPIIGPQLDKAGDELRGGKYAAAAGDTVGLSTALVGPTVVAKGAAALRASAPMQSLADTADAMATRRVTDVIKPTVGANKVRFANMAQDVAPQVARQTKGLTRSAIGDSVAAKLEDATAALDQAHDTRLNARSLPTQPVVNALQAARDKLTSKAVEGSFPVPEMDASGIKARSLGQDVVPAPNRARVAQIDQALAELKQLGPVTQYEPLRRMRQAYDGPAKAVYSPAVTADFLTAQGGKLGAADVTGALREYLAKMDPQTAAANVDYSLWKKANDVIQAAEETDRARPTVGRTMLARGLGALAGGELGGGWGAATGAIVAPLVERLAMGAAPAMKMLAARQLAALADALRAGNMSRAQSALATLQRLSPVARTVSAAARLGQAMPPAAEDQ